MTEAEWWNSGDPIPMLEFLNGRASERKLRLFAVACCRSIWHVLKDESTRTAVELAERYADGLTGKDSLARVVKELPMPEWPGGGPEIFNWRLVTTGVAADLTDPRTYVWLTCELGLPELTIGRVAAKWAEDGVRFVGATFQADLFRELFGNPFRPITVSPSWLTSTVVSLANGVYQVKAFDRMPILADALQDAGCDNEDVLSHCRGPGPHVRGCWVLDLLLGKE